MENALANQIIQKAKHLSLSAKGNENIDQAERLISALAGGWLLYKSLKNIVKHPIMGLQGSAAAGLLLYRGATGVCPIYDRLSIDHSDVRAINITEDLVVNAPRDKVYAFWRNLSNLPKFMTHLKSVEELNAGVSLWTANTPGGLFDLEWNAEVTREEEGEYLGWQSLSGSMIDNAGKIEFRDALNGLGTEIHIEIEYFAPAGSLGRGLASLFNGIFEKMILEDIRSFKTYVEEADFKAYSGLSVL